MTRKFLLYATAAAALLCTSPTALIAAGPACVTTATCKSCAKCTARTVSGATQQVTMDYSSCKGSAISWACCRQEGCSVKSCDGGSIEGTKCNEVNSMVYTLNAADTTLVVQMHDGLFSGDYVCTGSPDSAFPFGDVGNACGGCNGCGATASGVCTNLIDLSTCGGSGATPPPAPSTPTPAATIPADAECVKNADCPTTTCAPTATCTAYKCVRTYAAAGTVCRASAGACDAAETCTGSAAACPADAKAAAGTVCRASAGSCDPAETCDGSTNACPADKLQPVAFTCRAAAGPCDVAEQCTGSAVACPADLKRPTGTVCRASEGVCDPDETCDGSTDACPEDALAPTTYVCREAAGCCDAVDYCTGISAHCPADAKEAAGTTCRASRGLCDPAETCAGDSDDCPADALAPTTTVCRAMAGPCDVDEFCTGLNVACPAADLKRPSGYVCRASEGVCDPDETCDGSTDACPQDALEPATYVCREAAGCCDAVDYCTGNAATCPADAKITAGTVCRASRGVCDLEETCDGAADTCPSDALKPAGTECRAKADACDVVDQCTGTDVLCPADMRRDTGYLTKCGTTCYVCNADAAVDVVEKAKQQGSVQYFGGDCVTGACKTIVQLAWPACQDSCIALTCANGAGLGHVIEATCDATQPASAARAFTCTTKSDAFTADYCPSWIPATQPQPQPADQGVAWTCPLAKEAAMWRTSAPVAAAEAPIAPVADDLPAAPCVLSKAAAVPRTPAPIAGTNAPATATPKPTTAAPATPKPTTPAPAPVVTDAPITDAPATPEPTVAATPKPTTAAPLLTTPVPSLFSGPWDCQRDCLKCTGRRVSADGKTATIDVDVSACKGSSISWACCRSAECQGSVTCNSGATASGLKCDEVSTMSYTVTAGASSIKLQYHDGQLCGDVDCSVKGACCGGSASSCKTSISGVCERDLDLTTCGVDVAAEAVATIPGTGFGELLNDAATSDALKTAVVADFSTSLDVPASRVRVTKMKEGSLIVTFQVTKGGAADPVVDVARVQAAKLTYTSAVYSEKTGAASNLEVKAVAEQPNKNEPATASKSGNSGKETAIGIGAGLGGALIASVALGAFALSRRFRKRSKSDAGSSAAARREPTDESHNEPTQGSLDESQRLKTPRNGAGAAGDVLNGSLNRSMNASSQAVRMRRSSTDKVATD